MGTATMTRPATAAVSGLDMTAGEVAEALEDLAALLARGGRDEGNPAARIAAAVLEETAGLVRFLRAATLEDFDARREANERGGLRPDAGVRAACAVVPRGGRTDI